MEISLATDDITLAMDIEGVKKQVLELNKDLFILEEELLFPASTQIAVYVSLDIGQFFKLDAVKVLFDGSVVGADLYTGRQIDALRRGGIQRFYQGNIKKGEHEMVAIVTGTGPNSKNYRRAAKLTFLKDSETKNLELKIIDSATLDQPEFVIKEW